VENISFPGVKWIVALIIFTVSPLDFQLSEYYLFDLP